MKLVTSLLLVLTLIIPSLSHGKVTGDFTPITTVTDTKSFLCYNPAAAVGSKEEMITKANLFTQIYGSLPAVSETVAGVVPVTNGVTDGWVLTKQSNGSAAWAATGASGGIILASQAIGDLWYASSATATARLAAVAAGQPLLSGGVTTAPAYAGYTFSGTAGQTYTFPSSSKTLMAIDATLDDDNVAFDDSDNVWTSTAIGPALEELNDSINAGAPNGTGAKVHWSQLLGVPAGFADGTDDVGGFTPTSYDDITWGAAAGGSQTWTWDTGSSTDPNLTISDTGFAFNKDISATSFQSTATDASRRLELGNNTTAWSGCTSGIYGMSFDAGVLYICENGTKRGIISSLTGYATLGANTFTGTQALGSNSITMTGSIAATGARVLKGWFTDIESTNMPTVGGVALSTTFAPLSNPTLTLAPTAGNGAGQVINLVAATGGIAAGNVCYINSSGQLAKARADAAGTMHGVCVAPSAISAAASGNCITSGVYKFSSTQSWTPGAKIYVSAATAGLLTTTAPSTSTNLVQAIGTALAADTILIQPSVDVGTVQ